MKRTIFTAGLFILAIAGVSVASNPSGLNWFQHPSKFPAAQTIASAGTINADACGGVKRITAASAVTTSTAYTIGTLGNNANKAGCVMDIINSGTMVITLDDNASFVTFNNANIALGTKHSMRVVGMGSYWAQIGTAQNNAAH